MGEQKQKIYDLEERTYEFARRCRDLTKEIPRTDYNIEYNKQLIRSSGSTAANYIEANEAISKKDFIHRIKICRKEAKESRLWLRLIEVLDKDSLQEENDKLIAETIELIKIFSAIIEKSTK